MPAREEAILKKEGNGEYVKWQIMSAMSVYHHEPAGREAAVLAGWLVCHLPITEIAGVVVDLTSCGVDFPAITIDAFTIGFVVAEPLPNPLVVNLLAAGFTNGTALRPSIGSALTDPFGFRCPEKIIASFLWAS